MGPAVRIPVGVREMVDLKPTKSATKRTKNRLREHGPFRALSEPKVGVAFDRSGREWQLFESGEWMGWLPTSEIRETA